MMKYIHYDEFRMDFKKGLLASAMVLLQNNHANEMSVIHQLVPFWFNKFDNSIDQSHDDIYHFVKLLCKRVESTDVIFQNHNDDSYSSTDMDNDCGVYSLFKDVCRRFLRPSMIKYINMKLFEEDFNKGLLNAIIEFRRNHSADVVTNIMYAKVPFWFNCYEDDWNGSHDCIATYIEDTAAGIMII